MSVAVGLDGWTELMVMAYRGRGDEVRSLARGRGPGELEHVSRHGYTALMIAAANGRRESTMVLLREGACPVAVDGDGETAARKAERNGHVDIAAEIRLWARRWHPEQLVQQRRELLRAADPHVYVLDVLRICADYVSPDP